MINYIKKSFREMSSEVMVVLFAGFFSLLFFDLYVINYGLDFFDLKIDITELIIFSLNPLLLFVDAFIFSVDDIADMISLPLLIIIQYSILIPAAYLILKRSYELFWNNKKIFAVLILIIPICLYLFFVGSFYLRDFSHPEHYEGK